MADFSQRKVMKLEDLKPRSNSIWISILLTRKFLNGAWITKYSSIQKTLMQCDHILFPSISLFLEFHSRPHTFPSDPYVI